MTAEWFYIGHYGQLGPLTREQLEELIEGGVVARDTFVWRQGMSDWIPAEKVPELGLVFRRTGMATPPPPPGTVPPPSPTAPIRTGMSLPALSTLESDKSRTAGGILQLLLPGIGRIYLGYAAIGVLQLVLAPCFVGIVWSWIDGIIILSGGTRLDGYGRQLKD